MAIVIDLTTLAAAYAPRLMVESGHRVIRVESASGDSVRREGPYLTRTAEKILSGRLIGVFHLLAKFRNDIVHVFGYRPARHAKVFAVVGLEEHGLFGSRWCLPEPPR